MANRKQRKADQKRRAAAARKLAMGDARPAASAASAGGPSSAGSSTAGSSTAGSSAAGSSTAARRAAIAAKSTSELIAVVGSHASSQGIRAVHDEALDELVDRQLSGRSPGGGGGGGGEPRPSAILTSLLGARLDEMWEAGWQPLDIVHVVRREATPRIGRVAAVAIQAQITGHPRRDLLPESWAAQLADLDASPASQPITDVVAASVAKLRISQVDGLDDAIRAWWTLGRMRHRMPPIGEPPSQWSRSSSDPTRADHDSADGTGRPAAPQRDRTDAAPAKALATIRALLAKAESTTFPAEAEAFAAKAQELMTRYAIDAAMLDPGDGAHLRGAVRSRRIHIDQPYAREKVELLSVVGEVNQVRVVFTEAYAIATVVGFPADLDVTDMLYTSLLVQASRALNDAVAAAGRTSSPAFKRGFWVAYADRIWERLRDARESAAAEAAADYHGALVPVLAARKEAVSETVEAMFGSLGQMSARRVDAQGWYAGRAAADSASLGSTYQRLPGA